MTVPAAPSPAAEIAAEASPATALAHARRLVVKIGSSLLIDAADINRMARHFEISDGEVRRRYLEGRNTFKTRADGACVLLADGLACRRCTIHPARPRQCREFPYGKACPYLDSPELLAILQPRIDQSLLGADGKGCVLPLAEPDQPVKPPVS